MFIEIKVSYTSLFVIKDQSIEVFCNTMRKHVYIFKIDIFKDKTAILCLSALAGPTRYKKYNFQN